METFESVTASGNTKPASFTSNGQTFDLITANCTTGTFGIFIPGQTVVHCTATSNNFTADYGVGTSCTGGSYSGVSSKFIDNTGGVQPGVTSQVYAIKTANAALFTVKTLFLYLSSDGGANPSGGGGVTFRGKVNGSTVFTFVKTTGFNLSFAANNGFTYIDFGTYATTNIDELEVQGGASANYVAIDNFTFGSPVPLPVRLRSFKAAEEAGQARLDWTVAAEVNFARYEVERSTDGNLFTVIGQLPAAGKGAYHYYDTKPQEGKNLYRLHMVDQDGGTGYSAVEAITLAGTGASAAYLYPNPATGAVRLHLPPACTAATVDILDLRGRVLQHTQVKGPAPVLALPGIAPGLYLYRASSAGGATLGSGKIRLL